ncbi:MAG TPA: sialidase family protein [Methylotenera sp.]|nr:sialidase family protein [Methylotenera sp.]
MKIKLFLLSCFLLLTVNSQAHEGHTGPSKGGIAISVAFDASGTLWRASVKDDFVQVDMSRDLGKTFSKPVRVNSQPQKIGADGEARPKLAIGPEGNIYLTWTEALKAPFSGYIWFARSTNQGKSFEKPMIVHQDRAEITHRFEALNVSQAGENKGNITVAWVDKRDLIAAKTANKPYDGAAIYYAVSTNKGASFNPEQKLADSSCECCRIATTNKPDGTVVAMWRHVFENSERDHMIAEIQQKPGQTPTLKRATYGHWKIDGCPHHGAALASGGEGKDWWGYHMAYFDGNDAKPGLYYSRMDGVAWASSVPKKFGNNANQAGHPSILSLGDKVWLVWRETEAKTHTILGMFSDDGGKSWQDAKALASTTEKTDNPFLISKDSHVYLVWNTVKDGLKLLPL